MSLLELGAEGGACFKDQDRIRESHIWLDLALSSPGVEGVRWRGVIKYISNGDASMRRAVG